MNKCFLSLLVSFATLSLLLSQLVAKQPGISVHIVTSFYYPTMQFTVAEGINNRGDIVGTLFDRDSKSYGFLRLAAGQRKPPFAEPDETGDYTSARGINESMMACGSYFSDRFHGYLRSAKVFTTYDPPGGTNTFLNGLNDLGDFVGEYDATNGSGHFGFINTAGVVTVLRILPTTSTVAKGINNLGTVIGVYGDAVTFKSHGFQRLADGTLIYPFDFPGAEATFPLGINDSGEIVGNWSDGAVDHGFVFEPPDTFVSVDFPEATSTVLRGINNSGQICGSANRDYVQGWSFVAGVTTH
jgi:uncharacterized membrane protein